MRGFTTVCSRSTSRFVTTKKVASIRVTPCNTGMSRVKMALLSRKPVPGQVKTVSTRMDPPKQIAELQPHDCQNLGQGVLDHMACHRPSLEPFCAQRLHKILIE